MNLQDQEFNNVYFASMMQSLGAVNPITNWYVELCDAESMPVCHYLPKRTNVSHHVLHCNHNTISCNLDQLLFLAEDRYVLANGFFPELPLLIDRLEVCANNESCSYEFFVGVCGDAKSDAVKLDIEQYRDLRNFLTDEYGLDTSNGLFVYEEERVDMGIKSYFLYYDRPATLPHRKWYLC